MADGTTSLLFKLLGDPTDLERAFKKGEDSAEGFKGKLSGLGAAAGVAGAAAGTLLAAGFAENLQIEDANAHLEAQLGLTQEEAGRYGELSGQVYADNFGDSIGGVNDAIRGVETNLGSLADLGDDAFTRATEAALTLSEALGVDVTESTQAAAALVKNGLAKDSTEAFDIIAAGYQNGTDKAGDFLETLTEYSPQFSKLGISGGQALGILMDGLQAGARDTDVIADAFKEFSLRAIDGSKLTSDAYKTLGLDAEDTAAKIAGGGVEANAATQDVLAALLEIKDPIKQNQAGVALFGTQWEDTLRGILPAVAGMGDASDLVAGSVDQMTNALGDTGTARIETFRRGIEQWIQTQAGGNGVIATSVAGIATFGGGALAAGADIGGLVTSIQAMNLGTVASTVAQKAAALGTKLWAGAQWLLNAAMTANPIGIVIAVIAALVVAIIIAYKKSDTFRAIVQAAMRGVVRAFGWLWDKAQAVFGWVRRNWPLILAILTGPIGIAVRWIVQHFGALRAGVVSKVTALVGWLRGLPGRILRAVGNLGRILTAPGRAVIDGLIAGIRAGFDRVRGILGELTGMLPDWKGPASVDARILYGSGELVAGGFERGFVDRFRGVRSTMGGVTAGLPGAIGVPRGGGGGVTNNYTVGTLITDDRQLVQRFDRARARTRASYVPAYGG